MNSFTSLCNHGPNYLTLQVPWDLNIDTQWDSLILWDTQVSKVLWIFLSSLSLWDIFGWSWSPVLSPKGPWGACVGNGPQWEALMVWDTFGFFFWLGLLERFVQSPLRPWGSRAQHQMLHGAHWDQGSPNKPWLCLDFPLVQCSSSGRFPTTVMEK